MNRLAISVFGLALVVVVGGCSIAGTWKAVEVKPEQASKHFPMYVVTFADDGSYSATRTVEGATQTSSGAYTWNGMNLAITPKDGTTRNYPGHYCIFDGKLHLRHESEQYGKMTAAMEKQPEEEAGT